MKTRNTTIWVMVMVLAVTGTSNASLVDGLVGYYPFNGNANDESSGSNHGTVEGAALTYDRFGNPDSAYSFDGTDDYIDVGDVELVTGNTMSVQAWFNTTAPLAFSERVDQDRPLVSKLWSGVAFYLGGCIYDEHKIEFSVNSSWNRVESNYELNDGQWHHVVGVYDGTLASGNIKLYVDGVLQTMNFDHTDNIVDIPESLTIGSNNAGCSSGFAPDHFEGVIDDIRIYNRALSGAEVTELYLIPEPTTLLLLGFGAVMLRRKAKGISSVFS